MFLREYYFIYKISLSKFYYSEMIHYSYFFIIKILTNSNIRKNFNILIKI